MTLAGFALGATPIVAQAQTQQQQTAAAEEEIEQIIVTGTRLVNAAAESPVPVVQFDASEIDARGAIRIEDVLNILPQVFPGQTSEVSNGATGTSTLDLRGLGSIRTLVLIDGKRLPFGSAETSSPNLDIVPTQLIERVDIVTGGASAVYGSDALAGVANFILKSDFSGVEVDAQVGVHHAGNSNKFMEQVLAAGGQPDAGSAVDGRDVFATILVGANTDDGRGNVTAYLSYQNQNEILQRDRDVSACAIGPASGPLSFMGVGCVGSSSFRRFFNRGGPTDVFQEADGTLVPFVGGPDQTFNFGPFNFFQRPNERFLINARGHYMIADEVGPLENVEVYTDLSFMNNRTDAQIAPSASFFRPFKTNCDNPLLQQGLGPNGNGVGTFFDLLGCSTPDEDGDLPEEVSLIFGHRNVEGGNRVSNIEISTWRTIVGFRGDAFDNNFQWDAFGQFARTNLIDTSKNDLNFNRVQDALFIVDDGNGNPVCRSGNAGCVPWDVFTRTPDGKTGVTQAAVDYIQGVGIVTGRTEQRVIGGTFQGDLTPYGIRSPLANSGASMLIGAEYRLDKLSRQPDDISQIPGGRGLTGTGGATLPVAGQLGVWEVFTEAQIPLIEDAPFVKELGFSGAYRRSDYKTQGNNVKNGFDTDTWFVGLTWAPDEQVRVRAQFQRAIRAPNVIELFTGQNTGLFNLSTGPNGLFDPCAGDFDPNTPTPEPQRSFAECARTGVTQSQFGSIPDNPAGQFNVTTGGNPFLEAENGDTYTIGVVLTPDFAPGLTLAVDYFDIEIDNTISTIPPQTSLQNCLDTGDDRFCRLIIRDRFGSLFLDNANFEGVQATNTNIASLETKGVDISARYELDLADLGLDNSGSLTFDYVGTVLDTLDTTPLPGADPIKCKGKFAGQCGTPNPKYRHRLFVNWNTPWALTVSATWRYFGNTVIDGNAATFLDEKTGRQNYLDLVFRYQVTENLEARFGANNLLGNTPPLNTSGGPPSGNGNTFPNVFDIDRFIFFGINVGF